MKDVDSSSAVGDTTLDGIRDSILITDRIGHGHLKEHLVDYLAHARRDPRLRAGACECGRRPRSAADGRGWSTDLRVVPATPQPDRV